MTDDLGDDGQKKFWRNYHPVGTRPSYSRPMYLLRYIRKGEWRVVVIADAYSVGHARMVAAGLGAGRFVNGQRIARTVFARLPSDDVGRVLTVEELTALVEGKEKPRTRFMWWLRGLPRLGGT